MPNEETVMTTLAVTRTVANPPVTGVSRLGARLLRVLLDVLSSPKEGCEGAARGY
jgi:hypothetical protein